jgi:hypothetical protein
VREPAQIGGFPHVIDVIRVMLRALPRTVGERHVKSPSRHGGRRAGGSGNAGVHLISRACCASLSLRASDTKKEGMEVGENTFCSLCPDRLRFLGELLRPKYINTHHTSIQGAEQ